MSCLALTMIKLELSNNLLVPHALFACRVLVFFVNHARNHLLGRGEQSNTVNEGCSEKCYKIIRKVILVMEYFLVKLWT